MWCIGAVADVGIEPLPTVGGGDGTVSPIILGAASGIYAVNLGNIYVGPLSPGDESDSDVTINLMQRLHGVVCYNLCRNMLSKHDSMACDRCTACSLQVELATL